MRSNVRNGDTLDFELAVRTLVTAMAEHEKPKVMSGDLDFSPYDATRAIVKQAHLVWPQCSDLRTFHDWATSYADDAKSKNAVGLFLDQVAVCRTKLASGPVADDAVDDWQNAAVASQHETLQSGRRVEVVEFMGGFETMLVAECPASDRLLKVFETEVARAVHAENVWLATTGLTHNLTGFICILRLIPTVHRAIFLLIGG